MPQAWNNGIPPAYDDRTRVYGGEGSGVTDSGPDPDGMSSDPGAPGPQRLGVFPFSWGWQLAGLIGAIITSLLSLAASAYVIDGQALLALPSLVLLGLAVYSAVKTDWLRNAASQPLPVKIAAGVAVVCGLVPVAGLLLGGVIIAGIGAVLLGALGNR